MPKLRSQRGQTGAEYVGILLIVATIIGALFVSGLGDRITDGVNTAICRIVGGDREAQTQAAEPERCLQNRMAASSTVGVLIAVVRIDKDSTLIREDYSDGTSRFTILDNSEVAGEVFAGVKGKIAEYGLDYAASADAGLKLAGARVFALPDPAAVSSGSTTRSAASTTGRSTSSASTTTTICRRRRRRTSRRVCSSEWRESWAPASGSPTRSSGRSSRRPAW